MPNAKAAPKSLLQNALLFDRDGHPTDRHLAQRSNDWDEIAALNHQIYMPFRARPTTKAAPNSFAYTFQIGGFGLSRFRYGCGVVLDDFAPEVGRGIVLTTLQGSIRHHNEVDTAHEESFLVDTSRAGRYMIEGRPDHLQLNLTFHHDLVADLYERWHGLPADEGMWRLKFKFGGPGSSWHSLLEYTTRCIAEMPEQVAHGPLGKHLEEMLGMNLLSQWSQRFGDPTQRRPGALAPRFVKQAEAYLREHAREAPTLTEVAAAVGVSVRALTAGFRNFRGHSPIAQLRELRLQGVRAELLAAPPGATVCSVVAGWGYVNQGVFARAYEQRFGELPSQSLRRLRR